MRVRMKLCQTKPVGLGSQNNNSRDDAAADEEGAYDAEDNPQCFLALGLLFFC